MTRTFNTLILAFAVAIGLASFANADVVHSTDYEADGAAQGAVFNIQPQSMNFANGGGDFAGLVGLGLSSNNPNSGSYSYVIDAGNTVANGNGWGGTWSGISTIDAQNTGGFTDQATAMTNGSGSYIDYSTDTTFTVSANVATDENDPLTGSANTAVRLEIYHKLDADGDGVQDDADGNGVPDTGELLARAGGTTYGAGGAALTTDYQSSTLTYTLTAADAAMHLGIDRVVAVIGSDGHGDGGTDGLIFYDDLLFEVGADSVVTVPEPGSIGLILAGFLSLCGFARRKRN